MNRCGVLLFILASVVLTVGCAGPKREAPAGTPAWRADATLAGRGGEGGALAVWGTSGGDPAAPRVMSIPNPERQTYNLFWSPTPRLQDVTIAVRVQSRSGEIDQGGGPVWRVQDRDNYYICRFNPLESNFRVYRVVGGVRTQLASAPYEAWAAKEGAPSPWHRIVVTHVGDRIRCSIDGLMLLDVTDGTLPNAGGVGVWTKADAVTWFEGFDARRATADGGGE